MPITNNNEEQFDVVQEIGVQDNYEPTPEINEVDIPTSTPSPTGGIPNVNVKDTATPIIFLFGPPSSGKTMTLVRLYRYLNSINTNIKPNGSFITGDGGEYVARCRRFHNDAMSHLAAEATKGVNFMLLDIWDDKSVKKCQILESPGERLFEPDPNKKIPFPVQYVSSIINSNNRKVYIFILEPNYKDAATRVRYKDRIAEVKKMMDKKDKVIFLYNKIDCSPALDNNGNVNIKTLIKEINEDYPGLVDLFKVHGPKAIIKKYDCYLIPFQTGTYSEEFNTVLNKNVTVFTAGKNSYPQELWNTIIKCL